MSSFSVSEALAAYRPGTENPWHGQHAYHLLERVAFGGLPEEVRQLSDHGMEASVDFLLRSPSRKVLAEPEWADSWRETRSQSYSGLSEQEKREIRRVRDGYMREVQRDWIIRMISGPQPFIEKLALFFHSHFAVSAEKVKDPLMFHEHLTLFREKGGGDFRKLVKAVCLNPAMVIFLDSASNVKGRPNENFARELMELYTLGEGNGYTEQDVKEAARAFTGWRVNDHKTQFNKRSHDSGMKEFMGKRGAFTADDIVDRIFERPEASRFVAVKLFCFFVHDQPDEELCGALGKLFTEVEFNVKTYLHRLFSSNVFYSGDAFRVLIKNPVQLVISTYRKIPLVPKPPVDSVRVALRLMGQHLLWPPDVNGWKEGDVWINTNNLMMRYHWLHYITTGEVPNGLKRVVKEEDPESFVDLTPYMDPAKPQDAGGALDRASLHLFGRLLPDVSKNELIRYCTHGSNNARVLFDITKATSEERFRGVMYLMMSSPDYQLF